MREPTDLESAARPRVTFPPDPRDETMTGESVRVVTDQATGQYDVTLPQEMVDWLVEHNWVQAHGDWHNVRTWDLGCGLFTALGVPCMSTDELTARGLTRAPIQFGKWETVTRSSSCTGWVVGG